MTDSTTATVSGPTAWLARAVEAHEEQQLNERANQIMHRQQLARNINDRLNTMEIEPLQQAHTDQTGTLQGAVLLRPDFDEGTYEVRALWDEDSKQIELHTADWEADEPRLGRVRLLNSVADIVAARYETPKVPAPQRHLGNEALRAIDSFSVDRLNNHEAEAVVTAINGLTAAVLHVGNLIARTTDRP